MSMSFKLITSTRGWSKIKILDHVFTPIFSKVKWWKRPFFHSVIMGYNTSITFETVEESSIFQQGDMLGVNNMAYGYKIMVKEVLGEDIPEIRVYKADVVYNKPLMVNFGREVSVQKYASTFIPKEDK